MTGADADDGVVVDVVFEDGLLFLELINLGCRPALRVSCSFDPPLSDGAGRELARLPLFRRLEFLAPERRIRTLLDTSAGWFARGAPPRFAVSVGYARPGERRRRETVVRHDLRVFRDLAYVVRG